MIADGNPVISYYWGPCACMSYSGEVHAVIRCWFHFSYILAPGPRVRPDHEGLSTFSYCIFRAVVLVVLGRGGCLEWAPVTRIIQTGLYVILGLGGL